MKCPCLRDIIFGNYPLTYCKNKRYNPPLYNKKYKEDVEMTVCIAAICELGNGIIGASDRLKTAGDVTFEASQKFFGITDSIAIMTAGDVNFQTDILLELTNIVKAKESTWYIKDIAQEYVKIRNSLILKKLNNKVFSKFGLTQDNFLKIENSLSAQTLERIYHEKDELLNSIPTVSVIITGIDVDGTQLYVVRDDDISCHNQSGFASIGGGSRHARSQFMSEKYTIDWRFSDTLLLIHNAKKRSEIAPGVGYNTDMFLIEQVKTLQNTYEVNVNTIDQNIIFNLDKIYKNIIKKESNIQLSAQKKVDLYINNILGKNNEKSE